MVAERIRTGTAARRRGDLRATLFPASTHRIDQAGRVTHGGSSLEITAASDAGNVLTDKTDKTDKNDGDGTGSPIGMELFTGATGQLWTAPEEAPPTCTLSRRSASDFVME